MKRAFLVTLLIIVAVLQLSCTKAKPTRFDIVGKWGATTVTYYDANWKVDSQFEGFPNHYYNYWTFQINGALIYQPGTSGSPEYGDYVYNVNTKELTYIYEGYKRYVKAKVIEHSPTTMTLTADLEYAGKIMYTMEKLEW